MTETAAAALARLYDLDLADDPGDLDLYLALAGADRRADPRARRRVGPAGRAAGRRRLRGHRRRPRPGDARPRPRRRRRRRRRRRPAAHASSKGDARDDPAAGRRARSSSRSCPLNSLFLMGTRTRPGGGGRDARRAPRARRPGRRRRWLPDADDLARYDGRLVAGVGPRRTARRATRVTKRAARSGTPARSTVRPDDDVRGGAAGGRRRSAGSASTSSGSSTPDELVGDGRGRRAARRGARRRLRPRARWSAARSGSSCSRDAPDEPDRDRLTAASTTSGCPLRRGPVGPMASGRWAGGCVVESGRCRTRSASSSSRTCPRSRSTSAGC